MDNNHKSSKTNNQDKKFGDNLNTTNDHDFQAKKNIKMVWVPVENEDIKKVRELAAKVLGDTGKAEAWLTTPLKSLNGQTPTLTLENAGGVEEVRILLRKIESGEFT